MDARVHDALNHYQVIDLTTTGRRTGKARRIEIAMHNLGGRLLISGVPVRGRTRAWLLNVAADPAVTLHLRTDPPVDLAGTARVITDQVERRELMPAATRHELQVMRKQCPVRCLWMPRASSLSRSASQRRQYGW